MTGLFGPPFTLPPLDTDGATLAARQHRWRRILAEQLYGPVPPPPDAIAFARRPLSDPNAERIDITLRHGDRRMDVHAALWLPDTTTPVPLVTALDFVGPLGILTGTDYPIDADARVYLRPDLDRARGHLHAGLRGTARARWPVATLLDAGIGLLVSCYGSWTPDDPGRWACHGTATLTGPETSLKSKAISLWSWAISRLVDIARQLPEANPERIIVAGHSRLGKAALWAAANDNRIACTFANNSGCAGAAPARHRVGETLGQLARAFPHWVRRRADTDPDNLPTDQHALLAAIAPRALYLAEAALDDWADPVGSYSALTAAASQWPGAEEWPEAHRAVRENRQTVRGRLGYHLRPGGHDLTPEDWDRFLVFLSETGFPGPGHGQPAQIDPLSH